MDQDIDLNRSPIIRVNSAHSENEEQQEQQQQQQQPTAVEESADNDDQRTTMVKFKQNTGQSSDIEHQISLTTRGKATHAYKIRWLVLAIFCSHSAINSFQWIQYSSITNIITTYYGVSNLLVNLTSLVYMVTYIPFIIHASLMLERVGLRYAVCLGAAGTAVGAIIKFQLASSPTTTAFWGLMVGQTIVALSQLYIISIPPLLAAVWFPDHQVSTATGIGVFGNQLGIALGFIVPPLVVSGSGTSKETLGHELNQLSLGVTTLSCLIFILALAFFKDKPPKPPGSASLHAETQMLEQHQANNQSDADKDTFKSIKELCEDRDFQLLTLSYGINVGCFYAVSTVLNQMVAKSWPNPDDLAGTLGLLIVVSGMLGSVMCGQLLDRTHAFKVIIVLIYLLSLVSMIIFTLVLRLGTGPWPLYIASATLGFFMTGYLPLGFEFAAEITYPHPANTPAGLLNLSAQVFGVVLTYSSSLIVDQESGDLWANIFLSVCLVVGLLFTAIMRADLKRQKAVSLTV
uniref:Putative MFS-type transporter C09D4.1 n=1 Tax=Aceria tosichella TaxID=561515 RepID=A0A6G1SHD3_9ACAR